MTARGWRGWVLMTLSVALSACAILPRPIADIAAVPQPFRNDAKALPDLAAMQAEKEVYLSLVAGFSSDDLRAFEAAFARRAGALDILVLTEPPQRRTRALEGLLKASGAMDAAIDWTLIAADGAVERRFQSRTAGSGDDMIAALAHAGALDLAAVLDSLSAVALSAESPPPLPSAIAPADEAVPGAKGAGLITPPSMAARERPKPPARSPPPAEREIPETAPALAVTVGPVTGAETGNALLAAALTRALEGSPLQPAKSAKASITGLIEAIAVGNGEEDIRLTWRLIAADGREIGAVTQVNRVPIGYLDGNWDLVADDIATGAAQGLVDLYMSAGATVPKPMQRQ